MPAPAPVSEALDQPPASAKVLVNVVEAMGIEPTNLLHAMQALYQLSYAPRRLDHCSSPPRWVSIRPPSDVATRL